MDLRKLIEEYREEGLTIDLASSRVCQDIVLKAIADGPLNRSVTIKGGVVMRSITHNNRRATRDIDLDFIHHSISEDSIRAFIHQLDCIPGLSISIVGPITELKHQDYHGKCVSVAIRDDSGTTVRSKIDIGVHKHLDIEQEEYCFDICMDENGAYLLRNSVEQAFVEKLRSLLIFGSNSYRYKDIFDMFYLKDIADADKIRAIIDILILKDKGMREQKMQDIVNRVSEAFNDQQYLNRVSTSRQRWIDDDIQVVTSSIIAYLSSL